MGGRSTKEEQRTRTFCVHILEAGRVAKERLPGERICQLQVQSDDSKSYVARRQTSE